MKKNSIIALLIAMVAMSAQAQLLYKISGKGLTKPSYIIGTYHLADVKFVDSIPGLKKAMDETERRRQKQMAFNQEHGITPTGVKKAVKELIDGVLSPAAQEEKREDNIDVLLEDEKAMAKELKRLEKQMLDHAKNLEFEQAAAVRDKLNKLKQRLFSL